MLFYYVLRDALLKLPYSFKIIELNLSGEWYVQQVNGRQLKLSIASDSYVSECLTVLHLVQCVPHWRSIFWHRYIILLSDNVDPDLLRQLRVNLLWRHRAKKNAQINVDESS